MSLSKTTVFMTLIVSAGLLFAQDRGQDPAGMSAVMQAMSHRHEDHEHMGAYMHMSRLREPQPGDQEKAQKVVEQGRAALEKYRDYKVALAEGFQIFLPNVPQKMYHFTNYQYAFDAAFSFDPKQPTSLLYEKHGDGYKLIGAMYTAPVNFTEDQLNARIPLSVAQWHQHVNLCRPPQGRGMEMLGKNSRFGLQGSISTREACEAAGGTFHPHVFGWMVHMYPWEKTPDETWSVERQLQNKPGNHDHHDHGDME
jgi:hypothetical protein